MKTNAEWIINKIENLIFITRSRLRSINKMKINEHYQQWLLGKRDGLDELLSIINVHENAMTNPDTDEKV